MPELERLMLHRLAELDEVVRAGYDAFDFKRVTRALSDFMVVELSAFYFDIRKDALYCEGAVEPEAQGGGASGAPSVRLPGEMAGADAALHHRGGVARPLSGEGIGASRAVPAGSGGVEER